MGSARPTVVIATRNAGKVAELADMLADLPIHWMSLAEVGVTEVVPETGDTFVANAVQKAEFVRDITGHTTLADDSGLCVRALNGQPGVHTAHYGGPGLSDAQRVAVLLRALAHVPPSRRQAAFVCVLALARPNLPTLVHEGRVDGTIATAPAGSGGFGYDPVFVGAPDGRTMAELAPAEKNRLSHRGRAVAAMRVIFQEMTANLDDGTWGRP